MIDTAAPPPPRAATRTVVIRRTTAWVRLWHWINVLCLFFLFVSGLQIFNAHPALYWGSASRFEHPLLALRALPGPQGLRGVTYILDKPFPTTGLLGASRGVDGRMVSRGFPTWLTLPANRDLEAGRRWHFFFAWLFAITGALYVVYIAVGRRLRRDLWPTAADLKAIPRSVWDHLRLKHPQGAEAARFNVLQKLAYLAVVLGALPLMAATGLAMSPGLDAAFPVLPAVFGGRQAARTIHFLTCWSLAGFFAVHIVQVIAAGPLNEMRSILTGGYALKLPAEPEPTEDGAP